MKLASRFFWGFLLPVLALSAADCDLFHHGRTDRAQPGLLAVAAEGGVDFEWLGTAGASARAAFRIIDGQLFIHELAVRKQGGQWIIIGRDLQPGFQVTTAKRRISEQQLAPLRKLGRRDRAVCPSRAHRTS